MAIDKSHMEPAHPMVVALHDSLVAIYKLIREKYQPKIDATFDEVSRQIGFVVTTTVPVEVEVGDNGKIKATTVGAPGLTGTLFEKIAGVVGTDAVGGNVAAGKYNLYLIWYPALKLRLRTDFMEPAHLSGGGTFGASQPQLAASRFVPGVREPAHQPGVLEPVHIGPGIREPAHFQPADRIAQFAQEMAALLKRFGM